MENSSIMEPDWDEKPEFLLGKRDTSVLEVIEEEDLTSFTFEGLRRRLGAHPETLSRVLYRLEGKGVVEKDVDCYKVTSKARDLFKLHSFETRAQIVPLLQTFLPPDFPIQHIVSNLKGKWFGKLRWLGYSENSQSVTLKWITKDGGAIIAANFQYGQLTIDTKMLWQKDLNVALQASYRLLGLIAELISKVKDNQVAYLDLFHSSRLRAYM